MSLESRSSKVEEIFSLIQKHIAVLGNSFLSISHFLLSFFSIVIPIMYMLSFLYLTKISFLDERGGYPDGIKALRKALDIKLTTVSSILILFVMI
jgi:hypothetical protein